MVHQYKNYLLYLNNKYNYNVIKGLCSSIFSLSKYESNIFKNNLYGVLMTLYGIGNKFSL